MTGKEGRPKVTFAVYSCVCGYYIIAKDYRISAEHRTSINEHIKARHKDAKLNLRSSI
jgi:hypothetical protein